MEYSDTARDARRRFWRERPPTTRIDVSTCGPGGLRVGQAVPVAASAAGSSERIRGPSGVAGRAAGGAGGSGRSIAAGSDTPRSPGRRRSGRPSPPAPPSARPDVTPASGEQREPRSGCARIAWPARSGRPSPPAPPPGRYGSVGRTARTPPAPRRHPGATPASGDKPCLTATVSRPSCQAGAPAGRRALPPMPPSMSLATTHRRIGVIQLVDWFGHELSTKTWIVAEGEGRPEPICSGRDHSGRATNGRGVMVALSAADDPVFRTRSGCDAATGIVWAGGGRANGRGVMVTLSGVDDPPSPTRSAAMLRPEPPSRPPPARAARSGRARQTPGGRALAAPSPTFCSATWAACR